MLDLTRIAEAVRSEGGVNRRLFLAYSAALAALPTLSRPAPAASRFARFANNPFGLGVASGDPDSTSVILWTRLIPNPLEADGGMKPEAVNVQWEVAEDEAMKKVVQSGAVVAEPKSAHSVHVEAKGLRPNRWYWYRFKAGDATSPVGRTRTMPEEASNPEKLKFAFASCQHYEQGLYTAYDQMAKDDLDLVFFLGDYIYEYPNRETAKVVRKHNGPKDGKIKTLDEYRQRHALYRSDKLLHGMHAQCPWVLTWDDHEFDNNYANDIQEEQPKGKLPAPREEFLIQRAAAYQAYYEMMPLRPSTMPKGPDMLLYRAIHFGQLAEFFVLDTRQYRTDQPNNDGIKPLNDAALNPANTLLGKTQRNWLETGLTRSKAKWNVLAQQVMMAMVKLKIGTLEGYAMDQWPGAAHERMELVKFLADRKISNPVVLTGDIHSNWANELRVDDRQPETPAVAAEFVATSISSGGNGSKSTVVPNQIKANNPVVKFHNRERGYVRCTVTPNLWTSDYVVAEEVTKPNGPVVTRASFVVEAGQPTIKTA